MVLIKKTDESSSDIKRTDKLPEESTLHLRGNLDEKPKIEKINRSGVPYKDKWHTIAKRDKNRTRAHKYRATHGRASDIREAAKKLRTIESNQQRAENYDQEMTRDRDKLKEDWE